MEPGGGSLRTGRRADFLSEGPVKPLAHGSKKPRPPMDVPSTSEVEDALFEERAAIREFLGGMPRAEAEAAAREDVQRILAAERGTGSAWQTRIKS